MLKITYICRTLIQLEHVNVLYANTCSVLRRELSFKLGFAIHKNLPGVYIYKCNFFNLRMASAHPHLRPILSRLDATVRFPIKNVIYCSDR